MGTINSLCLFYISFTPLWLAILFIDIMSIFEKNDNLCTETISVVIIIVLFIISIWFVRGVISNKKNAAEKYFVVKAKLSKNLTIEFFLAYVLPMIAFDFTEWHQVVVFLIFFISLAILCVKHKNFFAYIVLEVFNYSLYDCVLENVDGISLKKIVISKKNLKKESTIFLKTINNEYMIEAKEKANVF